MKRSNRAFTWLVLICLLAAAAFAVDRYLAMRLAAGASGNAIAGLKQAGTILSRQPGPIAAARGGDGTARMKRLIQERSAQNAIRLGYLSESEGDAGKGFREKNVTMRFAEVGHAPLIRFLADLERMGDGATVKELRVRPSDKQASSYKSAECVLSWRYVDERAGGAR